MKLYFKQRFFTWFDSYDIYGESGEVMFTVEGQLSWGHRLHVLDAAGTHVATLKQQVFTFLPKFDIYIGENYLGCVRKEFSFFTPHFTVEANGWDVTGEIFEWDYDIVSDKTAVAHITKELFHFTDHYTIDVMDPSNALMALMVVLAIDAEKCSRD